MKYKIRYFFIGIICFFTHSHSESNREVVCGSVKSCRVCGKFWAPFGESTKVEF